MKIESPAGKLSLTSKLVGTVQGFPLTSDKYPHYKFNFTIKGYYGSSSFSYYGSYNDYQKGKNSLDDQDLIFAFDSVLGDAIAGSYSYEDFISEFGYDPEDRNSKKIYKAVQNALDKIMKLRLSLDEIFELSSWLREKYSI